MPIKGKKICLKNYLEEIECFEEALHVLNEQGEKEGLKFKRGNIQYWNDKTPKYKGIICACKNRHGKIA